MLRSALSWVKMNPPGDTIFSAEQLETLEVLGNLSASVQNLHRTVQHINTTVSDVVADMRIVERKIGTVYLPFQSAAWDIQRSHSTVTGSNTDAPPF